MTMTAVDSALGQELVRVEYVMLPWEPEPAESAAIDAVSRAVILKFDKAGIQIRWKLQPPVERIVVEPVEDWRDAPLSNVVSVSSRWSDLIGRRLSGYRLSYQHVESGSEPWAITLDFEGGLRLLLALGELTDGKPTYLPDSLVVTADALVASAYAPPASEGNPWE
jgi:hypothetical protein